MTKRRDTLQLVLGLPLAQLRARVPELKKELSRCKIDTGAQKGPKDVHTVAKKRKEVAQIKTQIRALEMKGGENG